MIRVGIIDFSNSFPLFHAIRHQIIPHDAALSFDTPVVINEQLRTGKVDIALVSSHEFLQHRSSYVLFSNFGIAATGPVISVRLFYKGLSRNKLDISDERDRRDVRVRDDSIARYGRGTKPDRSMVAARSKYPSYSWTVPKGKTPQLDRKTVYLPSHSATSVRLLKVLCTHFWKISPTYKIHAGDPKDLFLQDDPFLLIGDACLRYMNSSTHSSIDLAQAWNEATSKSFTFAVIAARKEACENYPSQMAGFHRIINDSYEWGRSNIDLIIEQAVERTHCDSSLMKTYFSSLEHRLLENHLDDLEYFSSLELK